VILSPWIAHSIYSFIWGERDPVYQAIFPFMLIRMLHNQIWISISRYQTAKGKSKIVDKGLEFEQVDRETNWLVPNILFPFKYFSLS
jgi:aldehyde decarbonylase